MRAHVPFKTGDDIREYVRNLFSQVSELRASDGSKVAVISANMNLEPTDWIIRLTTDPSTPEDDDAVDG